MTQPLQTYTNIDEMSNVVEESDVLSKVTRAMQWQYSASPRILRWSKALQDKLDATTEANDLYKKCFDVETAEGIFLDWIGRRIGIPRSVVIDGKVYEPEDSTYRKIVKFKAAVNVNRLTIDNMNRLLSELFEVPVSIEDCPDGQFMHIRLKLSQKEKGVSSDTMKAIRYYGLILKPAGVKFDFQLVYSDTLGFYGQELQTFDHGVFNTNE